MPFIDILPSALFGFMIACIIIEATPGPNMTYLAILASSKGKWAGLSAVAGTALGLLVIGLAAAVGLSAIIAQSPALYSILRWGGFVYLLWLAWDGWQTAKAPPPSTKTTKFEHRYFIRGLIINLLNPKAGVFYIAMLPGFINPAYATLPQTLILTSIYVCIATLIHTIIIFTAASATKILSSDHIATLQKTLAAVLVIVALWFAWKT